MSTSDIIALVVAFIMAITAIVGCAVWIPSRIDSGDDELRKHFETERDKLWAESNATRLQMTAFEKDASDRFARQIYVDKMFAELRADMKDTKREILDAVANLAKDIVVIRDSMHRRDL